MSLSEALAVVGRLVGCYPNGGSTAGDSYIGALAAVLVTYPRMIAQRAADPRKGIPAGCRFLPTPADVIAWCERETEEQRRPIDRQDRENAARERIAERTAEDESWAKARLKRMTLEELRAHYGDNWGLKDPLRPPQKAKNTRSYTDGELRALYPKRETA